MKINVKTRGKHMVSDLEAEPVVRKRWLPPVLVIGIFAIVGAGSFWASAAKTTSSLWSSNAVPKVITASDNHSVDVGVKFESSVSGQVTGVRFYKSAQNTGTHTGELWDNQGDLLATVTFKSETSSGWQTATFAQPVQVAANVPYIVSYYAPHGRYSYNYNYFTKAHANGKLTAPADTNASGNGVYAYANGTAFPTHSYKATNYWVDVLFSSKVIGGTAKPAPPASVQVTQEQNGVQLNWTTSVSSNPLAHYYVIRDGSQITSVSGTTLTYTDTSVKAGTTYAYQIEAVDNTGNVSAPSTSMSITFNPAPPTPVPTPTPTPGPTPTPTPTPVGSVPAVGSYVKPGTVGYRGATSALTVYAPGGAAPSGCSWISGQGLRCSDDNVSLDHVWIKGSVYWSGTGNFTLTNSIVQGGDSGEWYALLGHPSNNGSLNSTITVTDSTLSWLPGKTFPSGYDVAPIWSAYGNERLVVERCDLSGMSQGIDPTDSSIIENNWIHDLVQNSTDPNKPTHIDGIFSQGGSNITISGNYVDVPVRSDTTAAIFIQNLGSTDTGIKVWANYLNGGAYNLRNQTGINVDVENNTFNSNVWGFVGDLTGYPGTYGTWSGNVDATGKTIPKP